MEEQRRARASMIGFGREPVVTLLWHLFLAFTSSTRLQLFYRTYHRLRDLLRIQTTVALQDTQQFPKKRVATPHINVCHDIHVQWPLRPQFFKAPRTYD